MQGCNNKLNLEIISNNYQSKIIRAVLTFLIKTCKFNPAVLHPVNAFEFIHLIAWKLIALKLKVQ